MDLAGADELPFYLSICAVYSPKIAWVFSDHRISSACIYHRMDFHFEELSDSGGCAEPELASPANRLAPVLNWNSKVKLAANAQCTFYPDLSPMSLDNTFGNIETET